MALKANPFAGYGAVGVLVLLYQWIFVSGASFGVALGKGLVWPAVIFPWLGGFIGAILLVAILAAIYFA
ncbi:hypothetical protein JVX96_00625 [Variovorax sp. PDNC026]|uniref:hypothetical protein n=1 Tax=Variovorax sp. PDNC026 TaxID=2811425 RepID=UPI001965F938|nr:hypothetical protein [Variovorax sp. PDNC026]QRY31867.1 hypothetical protein JVX96_00625 [Variovorax sp. PDNC026]